jgi:hypothetical protein
MDELPRISWLEAEPARANRERDAMLLVAPNLEWLDSGGWEGVLPVWPFERPEPPRLHDFVGEQRFRVRIEYPQSYPMTAPKYWPLEPQPPLIVRSMAQWHVNPDGSLCMFQSAAAWDPWATAADLVPKAAGWFLEYLLQQAGAIERMTESGIVLDDQLDHLLDPTTQGRAV